MLSKIPHIGILFLGLSFFHSSACADILISLDTYFLVENSPNQQIQVFVSTDNNDLVRGIALNAEIGDGGVAFGGVNGPKFQNVDLVAGTIFETNVGFVDDLGSLPQLAIWGLVTSDFNPDSLAQGLLVTFTIDTTGFFAGESFKFEMGDTLNGSTEFPVQGGSVIPNVFEGTISIVGVPEPSCSLVVLNLALLAIVFTQHRSSRIFARTTG